MVPSSKQVPPATVLRLLGNSWRQSGLPVAASKVRYRFGRRPLGGESCQNISDDHRGAATGSLDRTPRLLPEGSPGEGVHGQKRRAAFAGLAWLTTHCG